MLSSPSGSLNDLQTEHLYQKCMWTLPLLCLRLWTRVRYLSMGQWLAKDTGVSRVCAQLLHHRPLLQWIFRVHTGSAPHLAPQTSSLGFVPRVSLWHHNHHLDGRLPTGQGRCCLFSPRLVALCMLLPSALGQINGRLGLQVGSSASKVRSEICGCGFQCVRRKGVLHMRKRSKGRNSVERGPNMSKTWVRFRAPERNQRRGVIFVWLLSYRLSQIRGELYSVVWLSCTLCELLPTMLYLTSLAPLSGMKSIASS